jgi:hypothetical protein
LEICIHRCYRLWLFEISVLSATGVIMSRLRINLNSHSIAKSANIISNGLLLVSNTYLIGSSFRNNIQERRSQRIADNLQLTAEITSAIAGLTKVITSTLETSSHETG